MVDLCDVAAADPADPQSLAPGVPLDKIGYGAVGACREALGRQPDNPRYMLEFGRASIAFADPASGYQWIGAAVAANYKAAVDQYGKLLATIAGDARYSDFTRRMAVAAVAGRPTAMYNFAVALANGRGAPEDDPAARRWYEKAGNAGIADARFNLARMYEKGEGGRPDVKAAAKWYQAAIELGDLGAMVDLGYLYDHGKLGAHHHADALALFEKAAAGGDGVAAFDLAISYDSGHGVAADPLRAGTLLYQAARASGIHHPDKLRSFSKRTRMVLQRQLQDGGFYKGAIDGSIGPATMQAVAAAGQHASEAPMDGNSA